jgi:hypothetical protein
MGKRVLFPAPSGTGISLKKYDQSIKLIEKVFYISPVP